MSLSNLQALIAAAISQIVGVAVAFGLFSTAKGQIIVSAVGTVLAVLIAVYQVLENQKAVAQIKAGGNPAK